MFEKFYPTIYVNSVYDMDFQKLFDEGYRGFMADVDNTLVRHDAPHDEEAVAFFDRIKKIGFKTCIVSNNTEERVKTFAEGVGSDYVFLAGKPDKKGYLEAIEKMGTTCENSFFAGDQLFTDIYGANNAKVKSVLVRPIDKDPIFNIKLKRVGEAIVKPFYKRYARKHPADL